MKDLQAQLQAAGVVITPVLDFSPQAFMPLDLSVQREGIKDIDWNDKDAFTDFIFSPLREAGKEVAFGGYGEHRRFYERSTLFGGEEPRSFHLGLDLWAREDTPVFAPISGRLHSWGNHARHGDYGPVIILEHQISEIHFFSLYGHLSRKSLKGLAAGKLFEAGDQIGTLGKYEENFHWPPHLHLQLIADMEGKIGDYPGVCRMSDKEHYLNNTFDPLFFTGLQ